VKAKTRATAVDPQAYRVGLWTMVGVLFLIVSTSCVAATEPKGSGLDRANFGVGQEAPPTGTLEVIQVDLDAIEVAPSIRAADVRCEKLESPLPQIVESADPADTARSLGLRVRQNRVQVALVLNGPSTDFLEQAGIDVAPISGAEMQAFVPIPQLCELAADQRVLAIRPVSQAETQ
jgi:hypothetical protein